MKFHVMFSGGGLRINHRGLIIINKHAKIGEWCDIHQGVNIGQNLTAEEVPRLGNNVWIGPGAKFFGKISIGNDVMVGANAVVCHSFPDGVRIGGVPAKIIKCEPNAYHRSL